MKILRIASTKQFGIQEASSEDGIYIEGYASTPIMDRDRDIIPVDAVDFEEYKLNPIVLYQHDRKQPIGKVEEIVKRPDGIWVRAFISNTADKLTGVVSYIKQGILKAFSIGFGIEDYELLSDGGYKFKKIKLHELSIVSVPANSTALFNQVKEFTGDLLHIEEDKMDLEKELEKLRKEKAEYEKALKEKEEQEKAEKARLEREQEKAAREQLEKDLKGTIELVKNLSHKVEIQKAEIDKLEKSLKESTDEIDAIKSAKPKIEFKDTDVKDIDDNMDMFKDIYFEAQLFKKGYTDTKVFSAMPEGLKAVTFDSQFVTRVNNRILEDIKVQAPLFDLFSKMGSQAKTDVYPFEGSVTGQWGTLSKSNYNFTQKITFDYKKALAGVEYSYDNENDTIISWLPKVRKDIVEAIADTVEDAIINSDGTTGNYASAFKGLLSYITAVPYRHEIVDGTGIQLTAQDLMNARAIMGKYGVDYKKLVYVVNSLKYLQLLKDGNVLTVDKIGNKATIINGSLGTLYGSNIIVTDAFPGNDTDAAGNYSAMAIRTDMWAVKSKPILVEIDKNIETQNKVIVASLPCSFIPLLPLTSGKITSPIGAVIENALV